MIHGFVRQSGGQVRVYSEVGEGTTMCLYLPRFVGDLTPEHDSMDGNIVAMGAGETVLVIDDEATVRMLIVEVLEEAGYTAIEAEDRKSTRLNSVTNEHLVCRLLIEKKKNKT